MKKTFLQLVAAIAVISVLAETARGGGSFDGTYTGHQMTGTSDCYSLNQVVTIVIRDNKFIIHYTPPVGGAADISVHVADDGTFRAQGSRLRHGTSEPIPVEGKITGRQLEANIGTRCSAHMVLTRS
jgi:hypothetical protein